MKKFIKVTAVLAAVFVVLLGAALLTLKIMFPAQKVQDMIQSYAQNSLQREVTFSGISFNLVGITINDLAISESKTFQQGTFLKANHVVFKMALAPLLRKRIEVKTVGIKGLHVNVVRGQDGKLNFDDLLANSEEKTPSDERQTAENSSPLFALLAEHIYAKDCYLYYKDIPGNSDVSVSALNLDIKNFDLANPFDAKLQFTLAYKDAQKEISLPVKSALTVSLDNLNNQTAYVTLQSLTTTYQDINIALKGGIKNFTQPITNLQGTLSGVSSAALTQIAPDLPHFVLPDLSFNTDLEFDLDQSMAKIVQAKLSVSDSALVTTGQTSWKGETTTYNTKTQVNLNLTQLATMTQLLDGFKMDGQVTGQLSATDKNNGQDVQGTLNLKDFGLTYPPVTVSDVNAAVVFKSLKYILSSNVTGNLNGQAFDGSFVYKDLGQVADWVIDANLSKLQLSEFSSDNTSTTSKSAASSSGKAVPAATTTDESLFNLRANLKIGEIDVPHFTSTGGTLTANLQNASSGMKQADGTLSFELTEGTINGLSPLIDGNKVVKILLLPLALVNKVTSKLGVDLFPAKSDKDKGKIKFKDGSGAYTFTNGVMDIQETHFNSDLSNVTATGNVNFKTEKLDMNVKASVLTSQTPIVIKIGGTISDPSGKLNVAQTAVSLVTGILNYKTPGKVTASAVGTATDVTKSVADTGVNAVKGTVNTAANTVKALGSLFKGGSKSDSAQQQKPTESQQQTQAEAQTFVPAETQQEQTQKEPEVQPTAQTQSDADNQTQAPVENQTQAQADNQTSAPQEATADASTEQVSAASTTSTEQAQ